MSISRMRCFAVIRTRLYLPLLPGSVWEGCVVEEVVG